MRRELVSVLFVTAAIAACASVEKSASVRHAGWEMPFGHGTATTYADVDEAGRPASIGVVLSAKALDGLPAGSDMHHCVSRSHDGSVGPGTK
jgi:hypothetical protein